MKKLYRYIPIIIALIGFSLSAEAQYRRYNQYNYSSYYNRYRYGNPASNSTTYRYIPYSRNRRSSATNNRGTEQREFNFKIHFNEMKVLLDMDRAINAAQRAAAERWMRKQESTFLKEINRQLGTKHTSFRTAQKEYYKNYEKKFLGIEKHARDIGKKHFEYYNNYEYSQKTNSLDFYKLNKWEAVRKLCKPNGKLFCKGSETYEARVRGTKIGSASTSKLRDLRKSTLEDFSRKEYRSAINKAWSTGMNKIINDGTLVNEMVNKHIGWYNKRNLRDRVFLMTAYLTQTKNLGLGRGPMSIPISKYEIPPFWNKSTLSSMGWKKAPKLTERQLVFKPNYINEKVNHCKKTLNRRARANRYLRECPGTRKRLEDIRDQVIREHLNQKDINELLLQERKPDYFKQWVKSPKGVKIPIHENAVAISNKKGQTIAFVTPDEKFFYWNQKIGNYSKSQTSTNYRNTYMYYVEDKYNRKSQPISWGIYKAADDFGGFIVDLVGEPKRTIYDFAKGMEKIATLDFDMGKTWEAILNADLSDAAYISASMGLAYLSGPKGIKAVPKGESARFQQMLVQNLGKSSKKLTWPELLKLFDKARKFENNISKYLSSRVYPRSKGYLVFNQVYLKVDGVVSIADNIIFNIKTKKWILNESKYGTTKRLSTNQNFIQKAIKKGKKIELRSNRFFTPLIRLGSEIEFSEILLSHSVDGKIIFNTIETTWKK